MGIKIITSQLDEIAAEIEKHNPVIAFALDKISDALEKRVAFINPTEPKERLKPTELKERLKELLKKVTDKNTQEQLASLFYGALGIKPAD